jgi:uroporphyrinogen-III decarboxylase
MRWAAKYGGIKYRNFCLNPLDKCEGMIRCTGTDIIDIDHLVPSLRPFASLLTGNQIFSGKSDPVTVIQDGSADLIKQSVMTDYNDSNGRCIVSAGCEITPGTTIRNMISFRNADLSY